jgi:hypothetical protein
MKRTEEQNWKLIFDGIAGLVRGGEHPAMVMHMIVKLGEGKIGDELHDLYMKSQAQESA